MISELHLPLILIAAFVAIASPGPATLAIAGTSMNAGRGHGLAVAVKSARAALSRAPMAQSRLTVTSYGAAYRRGLTLHLTNPKAVLFFGSLYSVGVPAQVPPAALLVIIGSVALLGAVIFFGYALIFSSAPMVAAYTRLRRWFEGVFAVVFAFAGFKILTARLGG